MIQWLASRPETLFNYFLTIITVFGLSVIYAHLVDIILRYDSYSDTSDELKTPVNEKISDYVWGSIAEELYFRYLPLSIAVNVFGKSLIVLVLALGFSAIFGYMHSGVWKITLDKYRIKILKVESNTVPAWVNVVLQGGVGFILSLGFLVSGGFAGHYYIATVVVCCAHIMLNLFYYFLRLKMRNALPE